MVRAYTGNAAVLGESAGNLASLNEKSLDAVQNKFRDQRRKSPVFSVTAGSVLDSFSLQEI